MWHTAHSMQHQYQLQALCLLLQSSTALMHAAWAGRLDMVRYLLSVGADRDAQDNEVRL